MTAPATYRIFLSAVTRELGSYRVEVARVLRAPWALRRTRRILKAPTCRPVKRPIGVGSMLRVSTAMR